MPKYGSPDLFRIIKSMSKTEKAYFKKFSELHVIGSRNNYLKLFDAIDRQEVYDEKRLLKEEKYITQLPYLKNYLTEAILKAMQNYYAGHTQDHQLRRMMDNSWFFYKKNLYDLCKAELSKAKQIAEGNYTGYPFLEASRQEGAIFGVTGDLEAHEAHITAVLPKERELLTDLLLFNSINEYYLKVNLHLRKHSVAVTPADRKKLKTTIGIPLRALARKVKTLRCTAHFHQSMAIYCGLLNDLRGYYAHNKKLVALCRSQEGFMKDNLTYYLTVLNNFGLACCHLGKFSEASEIVKEIRSLKTTNTHEKRRVFISATNLEMIMHKSAGDHAKVAGVFERDRAQLKDFLEAVFLQRFFLLSTYAAVSNAYTGNYRKALRVIADVFIYPGIKKISWLENVLSVLQIIFLDEAGADAGSFIKNFRKREEYSDRSNGPLQILLNYLERSATEEKADLKRALARETLHKLKPLKNDKALLLVTKEFDLFGWLESRASGRPLSEVTKTKRSVR